MKGSSLLGGVIVAGLTVGGAFVGRSLSTADAIESASLPIRPPAAEMITETVPIVAPVALGDEPPVEPDPADPTLGLGEIVGADEALVVDPATLDSGPARLPPSVEFDPTADPPTAPTGWSPAMEPADFGGVGSIPLPEAFADIGLADDPSDGGDDPGPFALEGVSLLPFDLRFADPCAPPDGEPAEGCPEGVRSTVLALESAPDLWLMGHVRATAASGSAYTSCPTMSAPTPDQLGLTFTANAPGTLSAWVQSNSDATDIALGVVSTSATDVAAWEATLPTITDDGWRLNIPYCVNIADVPDYSQLTVNATFTDIFGRVATFRLAVDTLTPRRPPTRVLPLGPALVLVSVAHLADEFVSTRARAVADGGAACAAGGVELVGEISGGEVSTTWLTTRGYDAGYTRRTNVLFSVPDGSTIGICSRTYDTLAPSYDRTVPIITEEFVVESPDLLVPTVTIEGITVAGRIGEARLDAAMQYVRGYGCGGVVVNVAADGTVESGPPATCDSSFDPAYSASQVNQNMRIITWVRRPGEELVTTSAVLHTKARACTAASAGAPATCPNLPTEWYRVPLGLVPIPTGMCTPGWFESTCEPPRTDQVAGTALVRVDWTNQRSNSRATWSVRPTDRTLADGALPAVPRLDETPTLTGSTGRIGGISGFLSADRPVDWTVAVDDCLLPENVASVSSSAPSPRFLVNLSGLCTGMVHLPQITITDPATGASASYNTGEGPHAFSWPGAGVFVAAFPTRVNVHVTADPPNTPDRSMWKINALSVHYGVPGQYPYSVNFPLPVPTAPEFACYEQNNAMTGLRGFSREAFGISLALPEEIEITVEARLYAAYDRCVASELEIVRFSGVFTREQLESGDTVTLQSPDGAAFVVRVVIREA